MMHHSRFVRRRCGISLMEVIFAMGVLLLGILGLASILGVASNNAQQSLTSDRTAQLNSNLLATVKLNGLTGSSTGSEFISGRNVPATGADAGDRFVMHPPGDTFPNAFCLDPWFLTNADPIRPGTANAYDRTLFPCYDDRYDPTTTPTEEFTPPATPSASAVNVLSRLPDSPLYNPIADADAMRRLPRIGLGNIGNAKLRELDAHDRDTINLIRQAEDRNAPPSLFLTRRASPSTFLDRSTSRMRGRFSYMVTARSNGLSFEGNVVIFRDREVVVDVAGDFGGASARPRHQLTGYVAVDALENNIPVDSQAYDGERIAVVTVANDIIQRRGTFTYEIHRSMDPRVVVGDFLCLIRRDYRIDPATGFAVGVPTGLQVGWFEVRVIDEAPILVGDVYRSTVTVSGPQWVFHPVQGYDNNGTTGDTTDDTGFGPYLAGSAPAGSAAAPAYDAGVNTDQLFGTIAVLMRNVVAVRRFP